MEQRRSVRSTFDANFRLPENVTSQFIHAVMQLPSESPKVEYLQQVLLDKFVSDDTAPQHVRRQRAINKWLAVERTNEATNDRLTYNGGFQILPRVSIDSFFAVTRQFVIDIVGEIPASDAFVGGFSGGASTSRNRTSSHPAGKYLGRADITLRALPYFEDVMSSLESWGSFREHLDVNVVRGNVLFTVPKSTEIDRCACKEPDLNMFMQRGLGTAIRRALRRVGIDLNDQSRNRSLARQGSQDGSLATLDLSSASDSVSRELVFQLMPIHWFTALDALRCEVTLIDEEEHRNEMFSSMGNGFTFELESLLFYALARATAYFRGISGVISVYGDDLIVPTDLALDLIDVLSFCGFEVNSKKSFWSGSFRESCGGHFVNGLDISPFYLRAPMRRLTDIIHIANALRFWSITSIGVNDDVWDLWSWLASFVPKSLWGGREYGDITQLVSPGLAQSVLRPRLSRKNKYPEEGRYLHWLNSTDGRKAAGDVQTSDIQHVVHRYRPAKWKGIVTRLPDLFLEEI